MRRIQFIELHEQPWFPSPLRDQITDALQCGMHLLRAYAPVAPLLQGALNATGSERIVDICSGGGGPWFYLFPMLRGGPRGLGILLTDKYPNRAAFERLNAASEKHISFRGDCVDAMKVPRELGGVRTMFSSFHHFPPEEAAAVLQDAVDARQSIGIFEITRRAPAAVCSMLPWALLAFVYTPLIRPFRWSRLFWTYLIPLIPFVLLFDGVVSCLRTYRPLELQGILKGLTNAEYDWSIGEYPDAAGKMPITYLLGKPKR